jgi:hypothetical protein
MPKPICVKCQRFLRPHRTGVRVLESKPVINGAPAGTAASDDWEPYKLWSADLWKCVGCGVEIINGYGETPLMQDFRDDAEEMRRAALYRVNDC